MIVAVFRSHKNKAIHIPVEEIISETVFSDGWKTYDITKKVWGWYVFDKFRFDKETAVKICLRGALPTKDRENETETFQEVHEKMAARIDNQTRSYPGVSKPWQAVGAKTFQ